LGDKSLTLLKNDKNRKFKEMQKRKSMDVLNKLVFHPKFKDTISDLNKLNIKFPLPINKELNFQSYTFPPNGELITKIEEIQPYNLNANNGQELAHSQISICAYDESVNNYSTLEGEAYLTSHSMAILAKEDYIPMNLLTLYFYTRAKPMADGSQSIRYSDTPEVASKKDYFTDKIEFLLEYVPENSILFVDGPLIGGDYYVLMIQAINRFLSKRIIPIFFVKNSESNLVSNNINELKYKFNSDMHWAYKFLKNGQRTNFFRYADRRNPDNAKVFCYVKGLDVSPQRIEFHAKTYAAYKDSINSIMDMIYYLILVQGKKRNPQIRPIAVAEKFAREALKLIDLEKLMKKSGFIPTMNEGRGFAW